MNSSLKRLSELLETLGLSPSESTMFLKASLYPGLTPPQLLFQCGFSRMTGYRTLERLEGQGLLVTRTSDQGSKRQVYALPLKELSKRISDLSGELLKRAGELELISQISAREPVGKETSVEIFEGDEAMEEFFSLHSLDWDLNLALGCVEPFLKQIGMETMKKWPRERARKGRRAAALVTKTGPLTEEITRTNDEDLRLCQLVNDISLQNQHIELFPELDLTMLFTSSDDDRSWNLTKIKSQAVTQSYERIVSSYLN